ncbi:MAG: polysaccharide biosynthesis/export family protein [Caulobacteraceae bacterium]
MKIRLAVTALIILGGGSLLISACGELPNDGPKVGAVLNGAERPSLHHYDLVDISFPVIATINAHPPTPMASIAEAASAAPNDLIGEGDVLSVGIYQPGEGAMVSSAPAPSAAATSSELLPRIVVDRNGDVTIPFAGEVHVEGLAPAEASEAIRSALKGKAVNPQVVVSVLTSQANSVTVIGEVHKSGLYPISANDDHLLDVIAAAGGLAQQPADLSVTLVRDGKSATIPVAELMADPSQNIRLAPRDQIRVVLHERKIDAFGALGHVAQVPMQDATVSLADVLARSGGLDTNSANESAVFVFRYERPEVARALGVPIDPAFIGRKVPIVYRLNLRQPQGYFLATKFQVEPDDLIDAPRANLSEIQKFFTLVDTATAAFYEAVVIGVSVPK